MAPQGMQEAEAMCYFHREEKGPGWGLFVKRDSQATAHKIHLSVALNVN